MTVFPSLGGGHLDDLARVTFDHDVASLAKSGALLGIGGASARISSVEFLCIVRHVHLDLRKET